MVGLVLGTPWVYGGVALFALTGLGWLHQDRRWWEEQKGTGHAPGRWGVLLFIGSEVMIFGALFATYFNFRAQAGAWPPADVHLPIGTTGLFTIILLLSGATMHWAHSALRAGRREAFKGHLALTLLLGAIFIGGQVYEYLTLIGEGVTLTHSNFAATFYALTGTHGLHVIAGLVALGIVAYRSFVHDQFTAQRHVLLEGAAVYWHFVDLVWVFVFAIVYLGWV
jgi:cytochrome c oxidase subunit 3